MPRNYVDTVHDDVVVDAAPRESHQLFGLPNRLLTGIDIYNTQYNSDRPTSPSNSADPHATTSDRLTGGYYAMNTTSVQSDLDVSSAAASKATRSRRRDDYNAAVDPTPASTRTIRRRPPLNNQRMAICRPCRPRERINARSRCSAAPPAHSGSAMPTSGRRGGSVCLHRASRISS